MFETNKSKSGRGSIAGGMMNNTKVMTEGKESEFQPRELKFAIEKVKIWHPEGNSQMLM